MTGQQTCFAWPTPCFKLDFVAVRNIRRVHIVVPDVENRRAGFTGMAFQIASFPAMKVTPWTQYMLKELQATSSQMPNLGPTSLLSFHPLQGPHGQWGL